MENGLSVRSKTSFMELIFFIVVLILGLKVIFLQIILFIENIGKKDSCTASLVYEMSHYNHCWKFLKSFYRPNMSCQSVFSNPSIITGGIEKPAQVCNLLGFAYVV